MLENALESFTDNVFLLITDVNRPGKSLLVKKHTENVNINGDFSFPNTVKSWHEYINPKQFTNDDSNLLKCIGKDTSDLVEESQKWILKIHKVTEQKTRIHLFLERSNAVRIGLLESYKNNALISEKLKINLETIQCDLLCADDSLTYLRLKHLSKTAQNLCSIYNKKFNIFISSKSSSQCPVDSRMILCGTVINAKTGSKEKGINGGDFIRKRQEEMTLIAQHKYGVRVSTDSKWKEFIANLGESAAIFDLLQTKPSSAVKINFDCSSAGSSKGAAFILYNCARLETIVKTFHEKVEEGTYPPLPEFNDIDFSLLTQEDEWTLVFNYILGFPSLLNNSLEINDNTFEFRPHYICSFLCSMVRVFSQYYRRVRILTEPRKHLLPVIFARIQMLKCLNETLKTCLKILNIKSVTQM